MRLGLDVTAVDLLPAAYIFLKAVLEYPAQYGEKLIDDVKYWGNWVTERLREDEDIKELYDDDVAVSIGTWEVKCPHCRKWTPLVGNWWLARVKDKKGYKRLAFMKPVRNGNDIDIEVVDVNSHGNASKAEVDTGPGKIKIGETVYEVPKPNLNARRQQATCLNCGNLIRLVDAEGNHFMEGRNLEWFVKWALKKYHEDDVQFARQRLLVKVKVNKDLVFEPCDKKDNEKLGRAKEKVRVLIGDPDVPIEPTIPYTGSQINIVFIIFKTWENFFNPRQILTLVKLIREAGKRIEEEKRGEGQNEEDAFKYAEAVMTYLAIGLCKFADYNSIATRWHNVLLMIGNTISFRGIAMNWNWTDENPLVRFTGSWIRGVETERDSLKYLISSLNNTPTQQKLEKEQSNDRTKVIIDDATALMKKNEKFNIIVTDPPYSDDVYYTENSDFYFVWLKRALSDSDGRKLTPRFHADAFFKKIGAKLAEIKTQWQEFAKKEISKCPPRFQETDNPYKNASQHFKNLLAQSFIAMRENLEENHQKRRGPRGRARRQRGEEILW
jgi:Adenine-specific DNA methylase containing a Zn-ribbon